MRRVLLLAIALLIWDRIEFLYYAFEGMNTMVGFPFIGNPVRIDSYVYFASISFQQIITAWIVCMFVDFRYSRWFLFASVICFVEYFLTYGMPIAKIPLPWHLYIPVSASTLRLCSIFYLMYVAVKKMI